MLLLKHDLNTIIDLRFNSNLCVQTLGLVGVIIVL
jgi:hypothetical protein